MAATEALQLHCEFVIKCLSLVTKITFTRLHSKALMRITAQIFSVCPKRRPWQIFLHCLDTS